LIYNYNHQKQNKEKDLSDHTNGVRSTSDGQVFTQLKRSIAHTTLLHMTL